MIRAYRPYDLGLFVGRLQHIHSGHEHVINTALTLCDRLLILVGSAQEVGTVRNPFNIATRIQMIKEVYPDDSVIVRALPDLTHENDLSPEWGEYVLQQVRSHTRKLPEVMIYGNDEPRSKWFDPDAIKSMTEVVVSRAKLPISATLMRGYLTQDDYEEWTSHANPKIHKYYDELRSELMQAKKIAGGKL